MTIEVGPAGRTPSGEEFLAVRVSIGQWTLTLLSLGAAIESLFMPDRRGESGNVHLTLPDRALYADPAVNPHLGATVGRYANRIAGAAFMLDGERYTLDQNRPEGTLHGGAGGWDRRVWSLVEATESDGHATVVFGLSSPDGDQGFPGSASATSTYRLGGGELAMEYAATTDAPTVISMTNHGYWNLSGEATIGGHGLQVLADAILPVDAGLIPTGPAVPVSGAFDLRQRRLLSDVLAQRPEGIDHCYDFGRDGESKLMALLDAPASGRRLEVFSDAPGLQVYTGNVLRSPFRVNQAVCLETQRRPDAPNQPALGSVVLRPDETYRSGTRLRFTIE